MAGDDDDTAGEAPPPAKKARTTDDDRDDDDRRPPSASSSAAAAAAYDGTSLELKCVNTIRALSADQPQTANSGHPGAPMGCAPLAHLLWTEVLRYSPSDPRWWNRDRFVLSNGHACALQYSMLHLTGYDLTLDDLKKFRKLGSKTPGHPECFVTDGVEVCTGPLGQGISNAVGFAIAERHFAATYNDDDSSPGLFDHFTYVICGDGCLQEGVSSESSSLAGHLGLGKLIVLYDDNQITIDGPTSLSFTEDVAKRYEAYGWHVQTVGNVSDGLNGLRTAIENAKGTTDKPSLIKVRTDIGYGSPSKEGTAAAHGAPLGVDDLKGAKIKYGFDDPEKTFQIDDDVWEVYAARTKLCEDAKKEWDERFAKYESNHPEKAKELRRRFAGELPPGIFDALPTHETGSKDLATRKHSESCLNALAPLLPELMGGSADLTPSNLTNLRCSGDFQKSSPTGRYLRFGVREHGMAAICNGLFAYGGLRPFGATFLNFVGYALGAVHLSALSRFGVIYVTTHDSIGLGEDGPTHQPIETLECLRSTPNLLVLRPADLNETNGCYRIALERRRTPSVICCSRSAVKGFDASDAEKTKKGAYVVREEGKGKDDDEKVDLILIGTGSELGLCLDAAAILSSSSDDDDEKSSSPLRVRVVSMPCQELFLEQSPSYRSSVLPGNVPTLSVEASSPHGWHRFSHDQVSVTTFGMSGKNSDVLDHFGFAAENVARRGRTLVEYYEREAKGGVVPDLNSRPPPPPPPSSSSSADGGH